MLFDAPDGWPPTPGFLRLYVQDADAVHRRAVAEGGTSVTEVTHLMFGDRVGRKPAMLLSFSLMGVASLLTSSLTASTALAMPRERAIGS